VETRFNRENTMSLITTDSTFQLAAALLALATFGFWAETKQLGRKLSGPLIIISLALVLSNINLIPHSAPMYGTVGDLLVPLAIPMLLFRADLKMVLREIGPMLKAFMASAVVIAISIIILCLLFDFGPYEAQVAGALAGSYVGGSLNFVATAQAVELTDPNHYVAALTADTIGAVFFLTLLMMLPAMSWARKAMPSRYISAEGESLGTELAEHEKQVTPPFDLLGLAAAITISMIICALGELLTNFLGAGNYFILVITILALMVANLAKPLVKRFNSEFEVGTFFMYIFFATIGASANLTTIAGIALPYVIMICAAVVLFILLILVVGKFLKLDLAELLIAANACILGPATAAAMAAGQRWNELVTPGMLAGILGYSFATFIGVAVTQFLI
jgi:uncharacterized membrane protein